MRETINKIKWIFRYSKPFVPIIILISILSSLSSFFTIYKAFIFKNLIDSATSAKINDIFHYLIILIVFILVSDIFLQALVSFITTRSYLIMCNNIQEKTYTAILNSRWHEFSKFHSGDVATRISSDADVIASMVLSTFPGIISAIVLLFGSFITLFSYDQKLAVIAFALAPLMLLLSRYYSKKLKKLYMLTQQAESTFRSFLNESIQNIIILKSFSMEKNNIRNFKGIQKQRIKFRFSQNNLGIMNNILFTTGSWTTFVIVFVWGSFSLAKGTITYGTVTALLQLFNNIQSPFSTIASSAAKAIATLSCAERIMELESLPYDINSDQTINNSSIGICFDNLSFAYTDISILKNISFTINPGECVAIVGPSGEGKTTLIRLLLALIYPTEGNAYLTVRDVRYSIDASCRNYISYVPQGNTLFSGTIADNLRFGNKYASLSELEAIAEASSSLSFINKLDNGFDTYIGERGLGLSEGQAQRLSIARALLKEAPILILDEATSSLDSSTELKILESIKTLKHKPTCLIITHRASALSICNRVLKLDKGNLTELNTENLTI